jgi:hypothetical protein
MSRRTGVAVLACLGALALVSTYLYHGEVFETYHFHTSENVIQVETAAPEDRHLSTAECLHRYPELYHEADRAERFYRSRGGIQEQMVDLAEKDGGHARLAIIGNKVSETWESMAKFSYT